MALLSHAWRNCEKTRKQQLTEVPGCWMPPTSSFFFGGGMLVWRPYSWGVARLKTGFYLAFGCTTQRSHSARATLGTFPNKLDMAWRISSKYQTESVSEISGYLMLFDAIFAKFGQWLAVSQPFLPFTKLAPRACYHRVRICSSSKVWLRERRTSVASTVQLWIILHSSSS